MNRRPRITLSSQAPEPQLQGFADWLVISALLFWFTFAGVGLIAGAAVLP